MHAINNDINGTHVPPIGGEYLDNIEPATGRVYSKVASSDQRDVEAAVAAAKSAFPAWSAMPASNRSALLLKLADLIDANLDELAKAESVDQGKPLWLTRSLDIPRSATNFRFFATAIPHSETSAHDTDGAFLNYTLRKPRGVAGLISPWNLPLYLFTWKIAPALATGNTVVGKPSELTPMTASMLCDIAAKAGLPPGVLNVVHGNGPKAGAAIITHPDIPAISFTGGTTTGKWIAEHAGPMFKRLSLELGGKNPNLIFDDCDLDAAVESTIRSSFLNQGEICLCGSRIYVQRRLFDEFLSRFIAKTKALKVGDPLDPDSKQGALVSAAHRDKVANAVEQARGLGGKVLCGGSAPASLPDRCKGGFFYEPTIITNLDPSCAFEQEEVFGPVVSVTPFDLEEEAIALANGTKYGLASIVWTRDLKRTHRVAAAIESGVVWINCWMIRDLRTPFGGMKQSGVGREGGAEALRFFTEAKNICVAT
jgi:aminomuconate-semialdehyde/2-hydroxymuconate-6-semialdehyde dehydrogenase